MIIINYLDKDIKFPSEYSEITLQDLDFIHQVFENEKNETFQWIEIVSYLANIPQKEIDEWPLESFLGILSQMFVRIPDKEVLSSIQAEDRTFIIPATARLNVRQSAQIEKILASKSKTKFSEILGLLINEVDTDTPLTLEDKIQLFKTLPASYFLLYLMKFTTKYANDMISTLKAMKIHNEVIPITTDSSAR